MGIPLIAGRDIIAQDIRGGLRVMVISAALAKAAWPNESAIGKRIRCCEGAPDDPRWKTIIGVAADTHTGGPTQTFGRSSTFRSRRRRPTRGDGSTGR